MEENTSALKDRILSLEIRSDLAAMLALTCFLAARKKKKKGAQFPFLLAELAYAIFMAYDLYRTIREK